MTTKPTTRKIAGKIYVLKRTTHNDTEAKAAASNIRKKYGKGTGTAKKLAEGLYAVYQLRTTVDKTATRTSTPPKKIGATVPSTQKTAATGPPMARLLSAEDRYKLNRNAKRLQTLQHIAAEIKTLRGSGMDTTRHEARLKAGMPTGFKTLRGIAAHMDKIVDKARTKTRGMNTYQRKRETTYAKEDALLSLKF